MATSNSSHVSISCRDSAEIAYPDTPRPSLADPALLQITISDVSGNQKTCNLSRRSSQGTASENGRGGKTVGARIGFEKWDGELSEWSNQEVMISDVESHSENGVGGTNLDKEGTAEKASLSEEKERNTTVRGFRSDVTEEAVEHLVSTMSGEKLVESSLPARDGRVHLRPLSHKHCKSVKSLFEHQEHGEPSNKVSSEQKHMSSASGQSLHQHGSTKCHHPPVNTGGSSDNANVPSLDNHHKYLDKSLTTSKEERSKRHGGETSEMTGTLRQRDASSEQLSLNEVMARVESWTSGLTRT